MTVPLARKVLRVTWAFLVLASRCQSSSFKPNCTLPADSVNYVTGANTRSTLSIVWNCFSVIILCTWNVLHLNVPPIRRAEGFWAKIWLTIIASTTKIKWMVVTILVPEYLLGKALSERLSVKTALSPSERNHPMFGTIGGEWGAVHCCLANMGYFVLDVQPELGVAINPTRGSEHEEKNNSALNSGKEITYESTTLNHVERGEQADIFRTPNRRDGTESYSTNSLQATPAAQQLDDQSQETEGDTPPVNSVPNHPPYQVIIQEILDTKDLATSERINLERLQHRYWALSAFQWRVAYGLEIATIPDIPSVYLDKLDRGGALVKALAIGQALYLIIQLISRKVQGLPSSQLEIATLAFSVLSLFTYITYWEHPQNVEVIHIIPATKRIEGGLLGLSEVDTIRLLAIAGPSYTWTRPRIETKFDPKLGPSPIPNDSSHATDDILPIRLLEKLGVVEDPDIDEDVVIWALGAVFGGIPFGGLHCLAWNVQFPTTAEATAWRVCSIMTTCLPLVTLAPMLMWAKINSRLSTRFTTTYLRLPVASAILLCLLLYILARLFLLAEMIRCLFFLPPEAFIDTWFNGFPHWG
ncbi:hypothetical protein F5Y06DRAFT_43912 [Hypoxylon sp. FL0890]|nr:hypothetical protein F5Y06DRAFT_43912 [Hypoxylon sp. FL0890]